tara:strand:+ start:31 stop:639 length:609 start_codon:yes stop_codon:yes gene_type:complete
MALVKYNNNSISSVTAAAGIASGDMNLITTNTISSGVSSSDFTSSIDSTYDTYIFKFIDIHPASNNVNFTVNFRDGSSAFDATKTTSFFQGNNDEAEASPSLTYETARDLAQSTSAQMLHSGVGGDADQCICGTLYLFSPSNTTFVKHFIYSGSNTHQADASLGQHVAGYCNVTAAIDGVQFAMSSGNIDSGVIKMYGLSKS